jgi:hypothetical protein
MTLWEKPNSTWLWQLDPVDDERSRLVSRLRTGYNWRNVTIPIELALMETGDPFMMRKCLVTIKQRAERRPRQRRHGSSTANSLVDHRLLGGSSSAGLSAKGADASPTKVADRADEVDGDQHGPAPLRSADFRRWPTSEVRPCRSGKGQLDDRGKHRRCLLQWRQVPPLPSAWLTVVGHGLIISPPHPRMPGPKVPVPVPVPVRVRTGGSLSAVRPGVLDHDKWTFVPGFGRERGGGS